MLTQGENDIQVFSLDQFGNMYGPATIKIVYDGRPPLTLIQLEAETNDLYTGEMCRVAGVLDVAPLSSTTLRAGRSIRLTYEFPGMATITQFTVTDSNGAFIDSLLLDRIGVWTIRAKFDGDNQLTESGWSAPPVIVMVGRLGDINKDDSINAIDVQLVINGALGQDLGTASPDSNRDGQTDAVDVQVVVNAALSE